LTAPNRAAYALLRNGEALIRDPDASHGAETTVFVATHTALFAEGLALALAGRFHVAGSATVPEEAAAAIAAVRPDVALVDVAEAKDLSWIAAIHQACPDVRVVALSVPDMEDAIIACAEVGIAEFVTRRESLADLFAALERVERGEALCSPTVTAGLLRRIADLATRQPPGPEDPRLTARESEVLALIDEGLSNKEIAVRLCIGLATVKNHVHNILEKAGARRRGEAAARIHGRAARAGSGPLA